MLANIIYTFVNIYKIIQNKYPSNEFPLILQIYTIDQYEKYICSKWFTSLAQCSCPALGTAAVERARPVEAGAPILTNIFLNTLINIYIKKKNKQKTRKIKMLSC